MRHRDLSSAMQELLEGLRKAPSTVGNDIRDALENAESEEEFTASVVSKMADLMQEAYWWGKSVLDVSHGGTALPYVMEFLFQIR